MTTISEGPRSVTDAVAGLDIRSQAFIDGAHVDAVSGETFDCVSPITGEVVAHVAAGGAADVDRAVAGARAAFEAGAWSRLAPKKRKRVLQKLAGLMSEHAAELALLETIDMGKPIRDATNVDVPLATECIAWYGEAIDKVYDEIAPTGPEAHVSIVREPLGVVGAVVPWNFPLLMSSWKLGPALATGNSVILKPAEQSPLTALLLAQLWEQAGGPKGVFQVLPARDPVPMSQVLISDPRIRKLTFTGSTDVGRLLYAQAAQTLKRVSLELGGNAPFLVFEDADMEKAAREVIASKFRNAGQTCICANRVLVQESVRPRFTEAFSDLTASLKVGDPMLEDTQIGPLVDQQGYGKVKAAVEDALAQGAKVRVGGEPRGGLFYAPTVLTDVRRGMKVLDEETFGPVAPVAAFRDEAEAIALANATGYGLAGYMWTRDLGRAFRVSEALEYGLVGVNDGVPSAMAPHAPFGGMKDSGVGREGGPWGLDEYLEVKLISMGIVQL